jgi:hypothetical protein
MSEPGVVVGQEDGSDESKVKRLPPKDSVLRALYLLSGNQCAFPGCRAPLIDLDGRWIAQVCHIEAALPKGERFNPEMTEEQRREAGDLLLLCYPHHVETDDVAKYSVEALRTMKRDHESRFVRGITSMIETFTDTTREYKPKLAATLEGVFPDFDDEQVAGTLPEINRLAEVLSRVSVPARELFEIIVFRAKRFHKEMLVVLFSDLVDVTGMSEELVAERVEQLGLHNLASFDEPDYYDLSGVVVSVSGRPMWPEWPEIFVHLREFVGDDPDRSRRLFVDLDLTLLDEPV